MTTSRSFSSTSLAATFAVALAGLAGCLDADDTVDEALDLGEGDESIVGADVAVLTGAQARSAGLVGLLVTDAAGVRTGYCSGMLVGSRTVLTAGHCTANPKGALKFAVFPAGEGAYDIFEPTQRKLIALSGTPRRASGVDLALLRLAEPAPAGHAILKVAAARKFALGNKPVDVYGFGRRLAQVATSGGPPQKLTSKLTSLEPFSPIFYVQSASKQGPCFGDSGGPAVLATAAGPTVIGVLSSGDPNCSGGDLYASTGFGETWLRTTSTALGEPISFVVP